MKNNISFYRHNVDSHNHWKFKTLRRKFGWCGEGKFWALNNMIGESENCTLDLTDEYKKLAIAADLDFEVSELDEFVEFLSSKCKLLIFEDGKVTTGMVQEVFSDVDTRRQRQREFKKQKSLQKVNTSTEKNEKSTEKVQVSPVEKEQSRVDQSKGEKSKVNKKRISPLVVSDETTIQQLKKEYENFVLEVDNKPTMEVWASLKAWILEKQPQFLEPYVHAWNVFAMKYKLSKVDHLTNTRLKKLLTRLQEPSFNFFEILKKIMASDYAKGMTERSNWKVSFDFIIENEMNYVKILEDKYQ